MNYGRTGPNPPLREALYALSMAKRIPDVRLLDEVVREYPQFSEELTDFAVELVLDALRDPAAEATEAVVDPNSVSSAVSRAISRFHNRLYAVRLADERSTTERGETSDSVDNPFQELNRHELRALGTRMGVNSVFIIKLRDRQINPESIPDRFKHWVSDQLKITFDQLSAHLRGPPLIARGQFYKADAKPKYDQRQSFADAVKNSDLTDEAQRRLLSL